MGALGAESNSEVEIEDRTGEEKGVNEVHGSTDSGNKMTGVFCSGGSFDYGLSEVAEDGDDAESEAKNDGGNVRDQGELCWENAQERKRSQKREKERASEALPCFFGRDMRDHGMLTDERPSDVGTAVGEFGDDGEKENVIVAGE